MRVFHCGLISACAMFSLLLAPSANAQLSNAGGVFDGPAPVVPDAGSGPLPPSVYGSPDPAAQQLPMATVNVPYSQMIDSAPGSQIAPVSSEVDDPLAEDTARDVAFDDPILDREQADSDAPTGLGNDFYDRRNADPIPAPRPGSGRVYDRENVDPIPAPRGSMPR